MSKWKQASLEEICDVRDGTHDSPKYVKEGYPLITSKNITNGILDFENVSYISEDDYNKINQRSFVDDGDILMPMIGTIGNPIIVNKNRGFAIKNVALIKFKNSKILNRYINYCLKSELFAKYVNKENRGGTQKFLSLNNIRKFRIPLPPLEVQKQIADTMDKTQEIIDGHKKQLEELDNLIKAIFYDMFGDPVTNEKGWSSSPLGEKLNIKHGFAFLGEFFSNQGEYVLLTPGNFYEEGGYRDRGYKQKYYQGKIPQEYILNKGDLLIAMTEQAPGLLGSPLIVPDSNKFLHNQRLGLIKFKNNELNKLFIFHLFNDQNIRRLIHLKATGTKVRHTSPLKIEEMEVPIPPLPLQNKFAKIVTHIEQQKSIVKQLLTESQTLFNSLLSKYFD